MSNNDTLKDAGLKVTHPRSEILDILQANPEMHLSADEIHNKLVDNKQSIGLATVYRVLTQLEIAGLIQKNQFSDNQSICTKCGKIIEFMNDDLEKLQEKISDKYQFRLDSHVMTLFGVCKNGSCQNE